MEDDKSTSTPMDHKEKFSKDGGVKLMRIIIEI